MNNGWKTLCVIVMGILAATRCFADTDSRPASTDGTSAAACRSLERVDFSVIEDAPAQVMEAAATEASGDVPAHCHVQGYIWPQVGFELQLPLSGWSGRIIQIGGGGSGGYTRTGGKLIRGWCDEALRRGYACIVSNMGHHSTREGSGQNTMADYLWAYNNLQAEVDFGFRSTHVTALAGNAIANHYYGIAPKFSYFLGCSGGGRQALVEAQRFPWDFDGIVAIEPGMNRSSVSMALHWNLRVTRDERGKALFSSADIDLLHKAVLARCDANDGLKDGVITDPRACDFEPGQVQCKTGQSTDCLSAAQVAAARQIYSGPMDSTGKALYHGATLGSEKGANTFSLGAAPWSKGWTDIYRYLAFMPDAGPSWKAEDFDFDTDYKRSGMTEALQASNNPDLRRFKAAGGKLLIMQGWHDDGSPMPMATVDYYETVERTMGGRQATQDFARLFMMPGRGHCQGGPGANAVDYMSYLEAWVEQGRAPEMMVASHVERNVDWTDSASFKANWADWSDYLKSPQALGAKAKFTRPLYPHPLQARYKGSGDPNDYRSFEPVEPAPR